MTTPRFTRAPQIISPPPLVRAEPTPEGVIPVNLPPPTQAQQQQAESSRRGAFAEEEDEDTASGGNTQQRQNRLQAELRRINIRAKELSLVGVSDDRENFSGVGISPSTSREVQQDVRDYQRREIIRLQREYPEYRSQLGTNLDRLRSQEQRAKAPGILAAEPGGPSSQVEQYARLRKVERELEEAESDVRSAPQARVAQPPAERQRKREAVARRDALLAEFTQRSEALGFSNTDETFLQARALQQAGRPFGALETARPDVFQAVRESHPLLEFGARGITRLTGSTTPFSTVFDVREPVTGVSPSGLFGAPSLLSENVLIRDPRGPAGSRVSLGERESIKRVSQRDIPITLAAPLTIGGFGRLAVGAARVPGRVQGFKQAGITPRNTITTTGRLGRSVAGETAQEAGEEFVEATLLEQQQPITAFQGQQRNQILVFGGAEGLLGGRGRGFSGQGTFDPRAAIQTVTPTPQATAVTPSGLAVVTAPSSPSAGAPSSSPGLSLSRTPARQRPGGFGGGGFVQTGGLVRPSPGPSAPTNFQTLGIGSGGLAPDLEPDFGGGVAVATRTEAPTSTRRRLAPSPGAFSLIDVAGTQLAVPTPRPSPALTSEAARELGVRGPSLRVEPDLEFGVEPATASASASLIAQPEPAAATTSSASLLLQPEPTSAPSASLLLQPEPTSAPSASVVLQPEPTTATQTAAQVVAQPEPASAAAPQSSPAETTSPEAFFQPELVLETTPEFTTKTELDIVTEPTIATDPTTDIVTEPTIATDPSTGSTTFQAATDLTTTQQLDPQPYPGAGTPGGWWEVPGCAPGPDRCPQPGGGAVGERQQQPSEPADGGTRGNAAVSRCRPKFPAGEQWPAAQRQGCGGGQPAGEEPGGTGECGAGPALSAGQRRPECQAQQVATPGRWTPTPG